MPHDLEKTLIYHITDVENLPGILAEEGLHSDAVMVKRAPEASIGYDHIKKRRLREIPIPCCGWRRVGEFVPFYFCPRSPMLFTINKGNTNRPPGCQKTILHLVSTMAAGTATERTWAVSSGNAGAFHTTFSAKSECARCAGLVRDSSRAMAGQAAPENGGISARGFFPLGGHPQNRLSKLGDVEQGSGTPRRRNASADPRT